MNVDASVYPDRDPPSELITESQKADYLHRILTAFDYGVLPDETTLDLLVQWKEIFDRHPLHASPAYHALRSFFRWNQVERLPYLMEPTYLKFDRIEGRTDDFEDRI